VETVIIAIVTSRNFQHRLRDNAIKFVRWQHHAGATLLWIVVGHRARYAVVNSW